MIWSSGELVASRNRRSVWVKWYDAVRFGSVVSGSHSVRGSLLHLFWFVDYYHAVLFLWQCNASLLDYAVTVRTTR